MDTLFDGIRSFKPQTPFAGDTRVLFYRSNGRGAQMPLSRILQTVRSAVRFLLGSLDEEAVPVADPAAVAKHLGLSYESFRKKFRQAMGVAPGKFQLDARTDRAVALLYQGRHTVREISELLGFCDEFYFSRCFKRRFGQSPRAFRKKNRGHSFPAPRNVRSHECRLRRPPPAGPIRMALFRAEKLIA